jgi:hypothetical protein
VAVLPPLVGALRAIGGDFATATHALAA